MIVLDVETTGTDALKHSLVSIGAIDFDNPSRQFYGECRIWDGAHVMDEALAVNGYTQEQIRDPNKKTEAELIKEFLAWIQDSPDHTIAGQNPSLDCTFVQAAAHRTGLDAALARRIIDQHSICYAHMIQRGIEPPHKNNRTDLDSDKIMKYVGIPTEPKPHIAINGAKWEAEAFSRLLHNRPFFDEFKQYPIPWLS